MTSASAISKGKPPHPVYRPVESGPVPAAQMVPAPPLLRRVIGGLNGIGVLIALAGFGLGFAQVVFADPTPGGFWMMMFQLCALVACVMGVLSAAGWFASGPAMTPFIVAGVLLVSGVLSEPSLIRSGMPRLDVFGIPLRSMALAEIVLSLAMAGLSVLVVLVRRPSRTFPKVLLGIVLSAPAFGAGAAFMLPSVRSMMSGWSPVVLTLVVVVVCGVVGVLLAIGSQFVIRALEIGIEAGLPEDGATDGVAGSVD
ncbi:MAG: hypothetical protein ACF8MJ_12495 [Phycisphaerales bacterium JB050]